MAEARTYAFAKEASVLLDKAFGDALPKPDSVCLGCLSHKRVAGKARSHLNRNKSKQKVSKKRV